MSKKILRTFTDEQRIAIIKEAQELGTTVTLRKHKLASSMLHSWRKKYNMPSPGGRARQASPGALGARRATENPQGTKDAIIFLRRAKVEIKKRVAGGGDLNNSDLLALLALNCLQGE